MLVRRASGLVLANRRDLGDVQATVVHCLDGTRSLPQLHAGEKLVTRDGLTEVTYEVVRTPTKQHIPGLGVVDGVVLMG